MQPYPLIWPDGGNKYIFDSIKWNTSRLEDDFNVFHHLWINNLDTYHKEIFMNASIKINEIVGWLNEQDLNNREAWHNDLVSKYKQMFGVLSGFDRPYHAKKWTQQQRDAVTALKSKVGLVMSQIESIPGMNTNSPGNDTQGICAMLILDDRYRKIK